ncbi:hypothetical protein Amsp01_106420 [Amycolatopsis sp. NBRC 101858]|uniref:C45 family autoproteolytic acyltransferase/hydolase n=1 Tax=Amycolatopsis sp. NBRC 101858 TaxID=3032200 RepID=UPI0024A27067|nr:C45 family autoproteolytic acyltransferase/hydolase [Amycolatopsis sp. NBRC 101858]GLY44619.1 hypothetical protein Amsp01_106420 [Amycolatopsis sp. NBRC 101858]
MATTSACPSLAGAQRLARRPRPPLDHYRRSFAHKPGLAWADVVSRVGLWLAAAHAPDLPEEMDGIAAGAGVHPDEVLALNARGEIARNHAGGFTEMDGCSSFALLPEATADDHVYCGQNGDWRAETEATTVLIRIVRPPKPTVIMRVEAGQVGRQAPIRPDSRSTPTASTDSAGVHKVVQETMSDHFGHPHGVCAHPGRATRTCAATRRP